MPKDFFNSDSEDSDDGRNGNGNAAAGPSRLADNRRGGAGKSAAMRAKERERERESMSSGPGGGSSSSPNTTTTRTDGGETYFSRFESVGAQGAGGEEDITAGTSFFSSPLSRKSRSRQPQSAIPGIDSEINPESTNSDYLTGDDNPFGEDDNDVKKLMRIWVKERGLVSGGVIGKWEEEAVEDGMDKLEQHVSCICVVDDERFDQSISIKSSR